MIDNATRDRLAGQILDQIHDMQTNGYHFGSVYQGKLPKVRTFSELHDHIDANVGWGEEFDALCERHDFIEVASAVFGVVDRKLRDEAGVGPTYVYADGGGLRIEDPVDGHSILSQEGDGGYFALLLHGNGIRAAAEQILTERGHERITDWEIVTDGGLRYVAPHKALRAIVV